MSRRFSIILLSLTVTSACIKQRNQRATYKQAEDSSASSGALSHVPCIPGTQSCPEDIVALSCMPSGSTCQQQIRDTWEQYSSDSTEVFAQKWKNKANGSVQYTGT